ncbi:MAG: hypothetical protein IGS03_15205 [Candidatus Sericytochromatia bacterium]|nr:hypothetical protein [Candidatus Sericytochromatia bacterium]
MGNISASGNQLQIPSQPVQQAGQTAAQKAESKSTLEKFGDTELGQFYQDSPVLSGVATGVTGLGVIGLGLRYDGLGEMLFNRATGGVLALGIGGVLAEDGIKDLREGKQLAGSVKTGVGALGVLGGAELLTKVPVLSKPVNILFKNGYATGGGAVGLGSAALLKSGVDDIREGNQLVGGLKAATGVVGALGATELIGRQFDKSLIIEPAVKFASSKGAQGAGAVLGSVAGAGLVVDGARRLAENGSFVNDAVGVAEVAGGALLASGATTLGGMALGSETLSAVLPKTAKHIGTAALVGTSYVLGKETVKNVSENGLTYLNVAAGTGAALSALGAAENLGFSSAFTKGGQYAAAAGVGLASGLLAKGAYEDLKQGDYGEGALKGFGALVGGGAALALADVPGIRNVGEAVLKHAWDDVIAPAGTFAVKNPFVSIPLAVGGAYAAYKLTQQDKEATNAALQKAAAEGGTPVVEAAKKEVAAPPAKD